MIFYDTETCGLHGLIVLIQYAVDNEKVKLYDVWREPVIDTLKLIEWMLEQDMCAFNQAYDHFHLCKLYTIWSLLDPHAYPEDIIDEVAEKEPLGRDGLCLKPKSACDVMLHARKGKYQTTMERKDIHIRKLPNIIAWDVAEYLEEHIQLDDIYFSRRKDHNAPRWAVVDNEEDNNFKDVVLRFKASAALKNLAIHALGKSPHTVLRYGTIEPKTFPIEVGYAPYALALSSKQRGWVATVKNKTGYCWPAIIKQHLSHWYSNRLARQYATDDVIYTRELYEHLGSPEPGDVDSELACYIGASRWRGYAIDKRRLSTLKEKLEVDHLQAPKAPAQSKLYLTEVMTADEKLVFDMLGSTSKITLENIVKEWESEPVRVRAQQILDARQAKSQLDLVNKLLLAGRFHASFDVIGALSGRMSGRGGDLNPQGIKRENFIRECFPLANDDMVLCGGDFDAFEVALAVAYYKDDKLEQELLSGKKIHALFGTHVYPDMTYEEILAHKDRYNRSKSAVFAMIYGGEAYTLKSRLGVSMEDAEKAYQLFIKDYPGIGKGRQAVFDMFCSMRQPQGIGTAVHWHEPEDSIATMFGFRRYFTLENRICKALFKIASKPPEEWKQYKGKVVRRDREQNITGACRSALYAAAFALQAANMRAAGNHVIQGSGAQITKTLQFDIWEVQPCGVHMWLVQPLNVHDELQCPTHRSVIDTVKNIVHETVESFRDKVPLIKMDWATNLNSWADK